MFDSDPHPDIEIEDWTDFDYPTTPKLNLGDGGYRTLPTPQDE